MKTLVTFTFNLIKDFEMFSGKTFYETHLLSITDIPERWAKENMPNYFTGRFKLVGIEYKQQDTETAMTNQTRSKYISEFKDTGICVLNEDYVCKNWNNNFAVLWSNIQGNEDFTFCIFGNKTVRLKVRISKEQARQIVERIKLLFIQDTLLRNAGSYRTRKYIDAEENRMSNMIAAREQEIKVLKSAENALYNAQTRPI